METSIWKAETCMRLLEERKGGTLIRYAYKPYCPWRHGYRRERAWKTIVFAARIILIMEGIWFGKQYLESHSVSRILWEAVPEENPETRDSGEWSSEEERGEIYGIGIIPEEGSIVWFHSWLDFFSETEDK